MKEKKVRSLNEASDYVIESIKGLGLEIKPGSRFYQMRESLRNEDGTWKDNILPADSDYFVAREALRDITLLEFFFDHIDMTGQEDDVKVKVKQTLYDSVLPQGGKGSPGRDTQAELFVFAVCNKACLQPQIEEPDVMFKMSRESYGIAVKRIKSLEKLVDRVKEGAKQIDKSAMQHGIIIVDISFAINPQNRDVFGKMDDNSFGQLWVEELGKRIDPIHKPLCNAVKNRGILGVILHHHQTRITEGGNIGLEKMTFSIRNPQFSQTKLFSKFTKRYKNALPNLLLI